MKTLDVFCDRCGIWSLGGVGAEAKVEDARSRLKNQGWTFKTNPDTKKIEDVCPACILDEKIQLQRMQNK